MACFAPWHNEHREAWCQTKHVISFKSRVLKFQKKSTPCPCPCLPLSSPHFFGLCGSDPMALQNLQQWRPFLLIRQIKGKHGGSQLLRGIARKALRMRHQFHQFSGGVGIGQLTRLHHLLTKLKEGYQENGRTATFKPAIQMSDPVRNRRLNRRKVLILEREYVHVSVRI